MAMVSLPPHLAASTKVTPGSSAPLPGRVLHAAQQFEAMLMNTLFSPLEHSFTSLPGAHSDAEGESYKSLGMQALASTIAAHGGLGIAQMMAQALVKKQPSPTAADSSRVTAVPIFEVKG